VRLVSDLRSRPAGERQAGFTVLELIVVLTVIAVLMGIAVPSFLSARSTAQLRAAQADMRTALTAVNSVYIDAQSFSAMTLTDLTTAEPRIKWQPGTTTGGPQTIAVDLSFNLSAGENDPGQPAILMAEDAGNGTCWYALQADNDAPWYGTSARSGPQCQADDAATNATSRTF